MDREDRKYDRTDEKADMEIIKPVRKVILDSGEVLYEYDKEISDLYGLDKDDCLGRDYPGISDKESKKD